jgi:hypothetical protein
VLRASLFFYKETSLFILINLYLHMQMKRYIYSVFFVVIYLFYLAPSLIPHHHSNQDTSACNHNVTICELDFNNDYICSHEGHYENQTSSCLLCDNYVVFDHVQKQHVELELNILYINNVYDLYSDIYLQDINRFRNKSPPYTI